MAKKLNISFKENDRDMKLYTEIISHGDQSNFVKDCIEYYLDGKNKKIKV